MANRKISDLTALTAPVTGDLLPIVDISEAAAADKNKKITYGTFLSSVPLGTAAAPSIAFTGDNCGIYSPGADQLAISTSGTGRLFVDSGGRVGVNKTPGTAAGLNQRVQIRQTGDTYDGLQIEKYDDDSILGIGVFSSVWTVNATYGTTGSFLPVRLFTGGFERLRLDTGGRLLVGASNDSGGALLQVNGDRVKVSTAKTPASATATGTTGEICWDASYIYVCTATNTWKRTAIATW